jgi:hypothetical protein
VLKPREAAAIRKIREDKVMEKERVPPDYQWHWMHENQSKTVCFVSFNLRVPAPFALYVWTSSHFY